MKIGFDLYCDEAPLLLEASKLFDKDVQTFGVTLGQRYSEIFNKENRLSSISDFLAKNWDSIDTSSKYIHFIEDKYSINNLSFFILSDRYLDKFDYKISLKILIGHFLFFEDFFKKNNIEFFIDTPVAILPQLVCFYVAKKCDVRYLAIRVTRDKEPSFTFINDWQDNWYKTQEFYKKDKLTEPILADAQQEIKDFVEKHHQPSYMSSPKQFNKIQFSFVKEFIRRTKKYFLKKQYLDEFDYITQNPFWYVKRDLTKILSSKIFNLFHYWIFDKINEGESYYLFPLHLQPEASTLMMAPYYVNQPATIENIAKSLPGNAYLYVKEHTSSYGKHSLGFYKQIKNIPNVRLLSPKEDTKRLINNAICPIVLTSTVGWEALLLGKPVVVLGEVFYKSSGLVYAPDSYDELSHILKYKVPDYHCDNKRLIKFLASIQLSSYRGIFSPAQFQESKILSKENIKNIYTGIRNELQYWDTK